MTTHHGNENAGDVMPAMFTCGKCEQNYTEDHDECPHCGASAGAVSAFAGP